MAILISKNALILSMMVMALYYGASTSMARVEFGKPLCHDANRNIVPCEGGGAAPPPQPVHTSVGEPMCRDANMNIVPCAGAGTGAPPPQV
ncbi:hypothetical protein WN943_016756 [Citrus x changshan-huyou]